MAVIESGSSAAGKANVDALFNLKVNLSSDDVTAGYAALLSEVDDGTVLGTARRKALEATDDYRLRTGIDSVVFNLAFEGTNVARDRIQQNDTTMTAAQASGYLSLNSGASTTTAQGTNIRTYRTFTMSGGFTTYAEFWAREANQTATNAVTEFGFGFCSGVTAQLTDGLFFRRLSGGQLRAVVTNNGTDLSTADITPTNIPARDETGTYDPTEVNHYIVSWHNDEAEFWINDVMVARMPCTAAVAGITSAISQPVFARVYNSGTASAARRLDIGVITVSQGEMDTSKPWSHIQAGNGGGAYQIQPGTASGPTVSRGTGATGWPTSATARAAGTWTATTAPATNSLGGQWLSPAISTLTSEADYPIFSYANPAGTATLPGKTLYVTGVRWGKTVATVVAATNSITLQYSVGVGGTSSATTQTEAAAVVASRGVILDLIPFKATAVVGDFVEGGVMDFSEGPLVVNPGCFLTFVVRPFGTVTTNTLVVAGTVAFSGYFE